MKAVFRIYLGLVLGAGVLLVLDQGSKALLRARLAPGESWMPWSWLAPFLQIVHTRNSGAAFSLGRGFGIVFVLAAAAVSVAIVYLYPRLAAQGRLVGLAAIFLLAGASGNLIDRLFFGEVTDFIWISHFAVINVADICINVGAGLVLLHLLLGKASAKAS